MAPRSKKTLGNVRAHHPEYNKISDKWEIITDVLGGDKAVKDKCRAVGSESPRCYLPIPCVEDDPAKNEERYRGYLLRAVFYNVPSRTLAGVVGQVFSKPPTTDFPKAVEYLRDDPAGTGVTLEQHAKGVLENLLSRGRAGLWVDYPAVDPISGASVAAIRARLVRPIVRAYKPEDIINWRTTMRGAKTVYSLIVLKETYVDKDNGFEMFEATQYRELRLNDAGEYEVRIWRETSSNRGFEPTSTFKPQNSEGKPFDEIPFVFVGIANNDSTIDEPPLYDIAILSLAHFRNSADYEEACFMAGQPTLWCAGLTTEWIQENMKGRVWLGSRGGISLPSGGAAGLLQVSPNSMPKEAMDQKELQMVALGARLVQGSSVVRTATEASQDKVTEVSTLAAAARNTSAAYKRAFYYCSMYSGETAEIKFELSTDFDMARMSSQDLLALFTVWTGRLLTTAELRDLLRRAGYATESLEDAIKNGVLAKPETPAVPDSSSVQKKVDKNASTQK